MPLSEDQLQDAADHGAPVELFLEQLDPRGQVVPPLLSQRGLSSGSLPVPSGSPGSGYLEAVGEDANHDARVFNPLNPGAWPLDMRRRHQQALHELDPRKHHPYLLRQQRRRFAGGQVVLVRSRAGSMREERAHSMEVTLLPHGPFSTTAAAWAELRRLRRKEPDRYGVDVFAVLVGDEWDLEQVPGEPELRMRSLRRWYETAPGVMVWRTRAVGRNVNQRQIQRNRILPELGHLAAHLGQGAWDEPSFARSFSLFLKLCPPGTQRLSQELGREGGAVDHLQALLESIPRAPPYVRVVLRGCATRSSVVLEVEGSWLVERMECDFNSRPRIARVRARDAWDGDDGWRLVRLVREQDSVDSPTALPMLVGGV